MILILLIASSPSLPLPNKLKDRGRKAARSIFYSACNSCHMEASTAHMPYTGCLSHGRKSKSRSFKI